MSRLSWVVALGIAAGCSFSLAARAEEPSLAIESPRLLRTEVSAGLGGLVTVDATQSSRWGDVLLGPVVAGQWVWHGLAVQGDLLLSLPLIPGGAAADGTLTARVGYSGERWFVLAGAAFNETPSAAPGTQLQVLPSVRAQVMFGGWGLSFGLFDFYARDLAHLAVNFSDYEVGYAAPLGLLAGARIRLAPSVSLNVRALGVVAFNSQFALLTVMAAFGASAGTGDSTTGGTR